MKALHREEKGSFNFDENLVINLICSTMTLERNAWEACVMIYRTL